MSDADAYAVKGSECRMYNRRVRGILLTDGTIVWRFKRLNEQHEVEKHVVRLSRDAVIAMFRIMAELDAPKPKTTKESWNRTRTTHIGPTPKLSGQ